MIKNILFVGSFPFEGAGGVGSVTKTLTNEFLRRGIGVSYLSVSEGSECLSEGVTQYFIPDYSHIYHKKNMVYVAHLVKRLKIDIIINQAGGNIRVLDFIAKANLDLPVLSVHHNCVGCLRENYRHIITTNFKNRRFFKFINNRLGWMLLDRYHMLKQGSQFRKSIKLSDCLVLLSKRFVPEMRAYVGDFAPDKVMGIGNPAPFTVVKGVEEKKENRLIFVGRLNHTQKKVNLVLDLWKEIYNDFPNWHFDIIGDGPAMLELEERVKSEKIERMVLHGWQDPCSYLEKAKMFCMTSAFEGFPMVLVEAQAYGVVPFAFDSFTALPDIIDSETNGFIFPKFMMQPYVEKLKLLMRDEEMRKQMAGNGQCSLSKHSVTLVVDQWLELMQDVIEKRKQVRI